MIHDSSTSIKRIPSEKEKVRLSSFRYRQVSLYINSIHVLVSQPLNWKERDIFVSCSRQNCSFLFCVSGKEE